MANVEITDHPLIGRTVVYRPEREPYVPKDSDRYVIANGQHAEIVSVFDNWNGVTGLQIVYVYVDASGQYTHLCIGGGNVECVVIDS